MVLVGTLVFKHRHMLLLWLNIGIGSNAVTCSYEFLQTRKANVCH